MCLGASLLRQHSWIQFPLVVASPWQKCPDKSFTMFIARKSKFSVTYFTSLFCRLPAFAQQTVCSWLRHYAPSWKVVGSIPDEVIRFFN
jgi:hypothetical protein